MKKALLVFSILLCLFAFCGCGLCDMQDLYDANELADIIDDYSSMTTTTKFTDGRVFTRYYEENLVYFDTQEKQAVYLSTGCYGFSQDKYFVELFCDEEYSTYIARDLFKSPLIASKALDSSITSHETEGDVLSCKLVPNATYSKYLLEEYGLDSGKIELIYKVKDSGYDFIAMESYVDGALYATTTVEYGTTRPELATELESRLNSPANQCRTIKVTLDPNTSRQRSVIARSLKGDGFKLNLPEGYNTPYGNHQCTKLYASKGSDVDAEMYLTYGR